MVRQPKPYRPRTRVRRDQRPRTVLRHEHILPSARGPRARCVEGAHPRGRLEVRAGEFESRRESGPHGAAHPRIARAGQALPQQEEADSRPRERSGRGSLCLGPGGRGSHPGGRADSHPASGRPPARRRGPRADSRPQGFGGTDPVQLLRGGLEDLRGTRRRPRRRDRSRLGPRGCDLARDRQAWLEETARPRPGGRSQHEERRPGGSRKEGSGPEGPNRSEDVVPRSVERPGVPAAHPGAREAPDPVDGRSQGGGRGMTALLTTSVGSFPKPDYLMRARTKASKGELSEEGLRALEEKATAEWIQFQEEIGIDIPVDGEQYRGDMATYFAENIDGTEISGLVRSYGNRYYKKPIIVDELRRKGPISVDWFKFAQARTERPVKGVITGPYTMMDWSFDEFYGSREEACLAFAKLLHQEALSLEAAGAKIVQVDEPALSTRFDELPLLVKAVGTVTNGLRAKTILHTCYGNYNEIFEFFNKLPVDQLDLEMSNSGLDLLERFKREPLKKEIAFGVVDVHSHVIEPEPLIRERIEKALTIFEPGKLYIDPDCGLKTRSVEEAQAKLRNMVAATQAVRKAHRLT